MSQLAVWNYGTRTQWSFDGLLTAVDSKWKGLLSVTYDVTLRGPDGP